MPAFYPENNNAYPFDDVQRALVKLVDLGATVVPAGTGPFTYSNAGDPNGVVTAAGVPAICFDSLVPGVFWTKTAGAGTDTGWAINSP